MRIVADFFIESAQHRDTGPQRVHRMRRFRQKLEHLLDFLWQRTLGRNLLLKFVELLAVRQLAVQQQVSDFLERRFGAHFVNVVAAIH